MRLFRDDRGTRTIVTTIGAAVVATAWRRPRWFHLPRPTWVTRTVERIAAGPARVGRPDRGHGCASETVRTFPNIEKFVDGDDRTEVVTWSFPPAAFG